MLRGTRISGINDVSDINGAVYGNIKNLSTGKLTRSKKPNLAKSKKSDLTKAKKLDFRTTSYLGTDFLTLKAKKAFIYL